MRPIIAFSTDGAWKEWAAEWTQGFLACLPDEIQVEHVLVHNSGKSQLSLSLSLTGRSTRVKLNGDMASGYEHRAATMAEWCLMPSQVALFDEADSRMQTPLHVERAAAVFASQRMDSKTFREGVRRFHHETEAQVRRGKPNMKTGHKTLEIATGATLVHRREDGMMALRTRCPAHQLTHLTFTPRVDLILPLTMLQAMTGRELDEITDLPFVKGQRLTVTKAWSSPGQAQTPGGPATSRTSMELASDLIALDEAANLIDNIRRNDKDDI